VRSTYNHHGCWHVGLAVPHSTCLLQQLNQRRIVRRRLAHQRRKAYSAILPDHIEIVLERYWEAVERSHDLTCCALMLIERLGLFDRFEEENFG
jgi:hypothetical protein